MKLLLDTHAVLWWLADDPRLSETARGVIADPGTRVFASVVSAYELGNKVRLGKLSSPVAREFPLLLGKAGIPALALDLAHMAEGASLDWANRDPWDRLIAAQARLEQCTLISIDTAFDQIDVERLW